jgi:hypothetical protein
VKLFLVSSGPRSSQAMKVSRTTSSYHSLHLLIPMLSKLLLVRQLRFNLLLGSFFRVQVYPALLSLLKFGIALVHLSILTASVQKLFVHKCSSGQQLVHRQLIQIFKTFWYALCFLCCRKAINSSCRLR